jgi:hypothetical protein
VTEHGEGGPRLGIAVMLSFGEGVVVFVGRYLFNGLLYNFRVNVILVGFWYEHCLFKTCVRNDL